MAAAAKQIEIETPPPVRVKPLSQDRFGFPGTYRNQWLVTLPVATEWSAMLEPGFWVNVARSLALGDVIECRTDDLRKWGLLIVIESNPGQQHARVAELFSTDVAGASADNSEMPGAFEVVFDGLIGGWAIYRRADGHRMKGNIRTQEAARDILLTEYEPRSPDRTQIVGH